MRSLGEWMEVLGGFRATPGAVRGTPGGHTGSKGGYGYEVGGIRRRERGLPAGWGRLRIECEFISGQLGFRLFGLPQERVEPCGDGGCGSVRHVGGGGGD